MHIEQTEQNDESDFFESNLIDKKLSDEAKTDSPIDGTKEIANKALKLKSLIQRLGGNHLPPPITDKADFKRKTGQKNRWIQDVQGGSADKKSTGTLSRLQ